MAIPPRSPIQVSQHTQGDLRWSNSERKIARRAFEHALNQELQEVLQQAKQMAAQIKDPAGLWELEQYLTERRKEIDRRYQFRESKRSSVFGTLLHEGRLTEEQLRGIGEDKLKKVRSHADFLRLADEPIQRMGGR
jgi:seryl-tRNA(Sec) selenium transferase